MKPRCVQVHQVLFAQHARTLDQLSDHHWFG